MSEVILFLYIVTCLLWCLYAMRQQEQLYPTTGLCRILSVGVGNFVFCPICILVAIIKFEKNLKKKEGIDDSSI
jgi:hypothetical protein